MRAARAETGFAMDGFGMEGLGFPTETTTAQWELELTARGIYGDAVAAGLDGGDESSNEAARDWATSGAVLQREAHVGYLLKSLRRLSAGHVVLDASRCWLCYWIVHSLALLGYVLPEELGNDVVAFLSLCQSNEGGFGGGPGQASHLAPTYAAVCCLATIATDAATQVVDKKTMREFLMQCKDQNRGGFKMHAGGETVSVLHTSQVRCLRNTSYEHYERLTLIFLSCQDVRGCFTALAVAHLLRIDSELNSRDSELKRGVPSFVKRCQTHEGGIAGEPYAEAHGGYSFCGLAAVTLCGEAHVLDLNELTRWLAHRQGTAEGGFSGRTNKLVDGCYSFWQGGAFPLLRLVHDLGGKQGEPGGEGGTTTATEKAEKTDLHTKPEAAKVKTNAATGVPACVLFPIAQNEPITNPGFGYNALALQGWLLLCCQLKHGGLQDKPGKGRDHYHTCYCAYCAFPKSDTRRAVHRPRSRGHVRR